MKNKKRTPDDQSGVQTDDGKLLSVSTAMIIPSEAENFNVIRKVAEK
jgi:hypothetical protein